MVNTIPSDAHVAGDTAHVTDHNNIADMLTLVAEYNVKNTAYGAVGDGVADDTAAIQAAITAAQNAGGGVVYLPWGNYYVTSPLVVTTSKVWIKGARRGLTRILHGITGSSGTVASTTGSVFVFHGTVPAHGSPTTTLTANATPTAAVNSADPFQSTYTITVTSAAGISAGDYLLIGDTFAYTWANTGWNPRYRGEITRVLSVSSNTLTLYGTVRDSYTTGRTASVWKLTMLSGVGISDLTITSAAGVQGTSWTGGVMFQACRDAIAEDLTIENLDEHGILPQYAVNTQISNYLARDLTDSPANNRFGYGVNCGPCEGVVVGNSTFVNVRHGVTTNGLTNNTGWPRNILVHGCQAYDCTLPAFDCHPGASDITFAGCKVFGSLDTSFQIRAQRVRVVGCDSHNPGVYGAYVWGQNAADVEITDCRFSAGTDAGVYLNGNGTDGYPDTVTIRGNYFDAPGAGAVEFAQPATNVRVVDNTVVTPGGATPSAFVMDAAVAVVGAQIIGNKVFTANSVVSTTGSESSLVLVGNRLSGVTGSSPAAVKGGGTSVGSNTIVDNQRVDQWASPLATSRTVFKQSTSAMTPNASSGTFGSTSTLTPDSGFAGFMPSAMNTVTASIGAETLTVQSVATYSDATTTTQSSLLSITTSGTTSTGLSSIISMLSGADGKYITSIAFNIKSSINSSTATVTVNILGLNQN